MRYCQGRSARVRADGRRQECGVRRRCRPPISTLTRASSQSNRTALPLSTLCRRSWCSAFTNGTPKHSRLKPSIGSNRSTRPNWSCRLSYQTCVRRGTTRSKRMTTQPARCGSFAAREILQNRNRYGYDIGVSPRRGNPYCMRHEVHGRCEQVADDRDHATRTIEYGGSGGTVVQHEAVVSVVQLEQRRSRELVAVAILHESTPCHPQASAGIAETRKRLLRNKGLHPQLKALRTGGSSLQIQHDDPFSVGARDMLDAGGNRLGDLALPELDFRPVLARQIHGRRNMFDGDH